MSDRDIGNECMDEAAKLLGISEDEVLASFASWMNETFPEMWEAAGESADGLTDEDFNDYADMFFTANRPTGGGSGGGGGDEWVGMFIGFDRRFDMMKRKRETAIDVASGDLGQAIRNGFSYNGKQVHVGRAHTFEGVWRVEHKDGMFVSNESSDSRPDWVITINESVSIAMLKDDLTPQRATSMKSIWTFHGAPKDDFMTKGPSLITVEGAFEGALHDWKMWQPVTIKGRFDAEGWNNSGPTLSVSNANSTAYGLEWVPEGKKREKAETIFNPEQYLTTTGDAAINLKDLLSNHFDNRKESYTDRNGVQRYDGPLVCVVGGVLDINHEGRESQWDPTGRDYWLSLSTQALRRENPNARVGISVSGAVKGVHNALSVQKGGEWLPYAKGSRIWVVGRTDSYTNQDGEDVVKIQAQGIYAVPHKSIPARVPSNESNDLGNLGGFGVGGDE